MQEHCQNSTRRRAFCCDAKLVCLVPECFSSLSFLSECFVQWFTLSWEHWTTSVQVDLWRQQRVCRYQLQRWLVQWMYKKELTTENWKCRIWGSRGTIMTLFWILRSLWHTNRPQKRVFQQILGLWQKRFGHFCFHEKHFEFSKTMLPMLTSIEGFVEEQQRMRL